MIPTMDEIEEYFEIIEDFFLSSLSPNVREAAHRMWEDIARYGPSGLPSFQDMRVPGLGDFQIPPPPPPVPPKTWFEASTDWIGDHPWQASGMVLGVIGAGLLVGYRAVHAKHERVIKIKSISKERRQVVVVLGGDNPLAFPLISELEKKGYIVIVSVSSPEEVDRLERRCHGYVCALVLDPSDPSTIPVFLRSLTSTISRRFPLNTPGDPYAPLASHPYAHSVICLLTLPSSTIPPRAPLEHLSLSNAYLPYLTATHITPLQIIQALMPLLRTTPARSRDVAVNGNGKKSIIFCLSATDARVGLPFASAQAMSAAATLRGAEILRREINAAALTDKSDSMKNIRVVIVDVGALRVEPTATDVVSPQEAYRAMEDWTASEKLTYGPAFATVTRIAVPRPTAFWEKIVSFFKGNVPFGIGRRPSDVSVFVDTLVGVVSGGRKCCSRFGLCGGWGRRERLAVGAGAMTYGMASHLPSIVLDTLLNIPHILVSIRNRLLPVPPAIPQGPLPPDVPLGGPSGSKNDGSDHESGNETSEHASEADVESNAGDGPGVDSSWVSLKQRLGSE